jgi:superfamily I DNA and/or RNA helicase
MWHTFFLVVPVISTTFASVQTMFKQLGADNIPWLLIDEAGQSVPQAAAGAIWRARRVGIVGDPFQIEPVVTIPKLIMKNLRDHFNLTADQVSDEFSVQVMADRVNPFGAELVQSGRKSWVGIPLRVHRRCLDPMFSIANNIAYDNKMYCSTLTPETIAVSFPTDFLHVEGKVRGRHFVPEQAEKVVALLEREIRVQKELPSIFVITPFTEVRYQLLQKLENPLRIALSKVRPTDPYEVANWLKDHVGTVHTFQGKQAEGVIFCLGLDESKTGAAAWAAQKPNLLNVALTRAKYRFIAIGDQQVWLKQAYFGELKGLRVTQEATVE